VGTIPLVLVRLIFGPLEFLAVVKLVHEPDSTAVLQDSLPVVDWASWVQAPVLLVEEGVELVLAARLQVKNSNQ
jgi:hypothetical protein